jgi:hypothetical protein
MRTLFLLPLVAACGTSPPDVVGPFDGPVHRFAVDQFHLPTSNGVARQYGDDLSGDGAPDNQLGMVLGTLAGNGDLAPHPDDLIAAGLVSSTVEIQANSLVDDPHVGVRYLGSPDDPAVAVGGSFVAGSFVSNRIRDGAHTARASLVLPAIIDADPSTIPLAYGELALQPDGAGGYLAQVRGLIPGDVALHQAAIGLQHMVMSNPRDHHEAFLQFDKNDDSQVTVDEVESDYTLSSLLAADVEYDGSTWLSFGFEVHLVPCDTGTCFPTAIVDHCDDRVRDGDESDIDCGGSCRACAFEAECTTAADCESAACDGGTCRAPTCSDGARDGLETGVDCGRQCGWCAGDACLTNADCASGVCNLQHVCT